VTGFTALWARRAHFHLDAATADSLVVGLRSPVDVHTTPTWCDRQHIIFRFCEFRFESWRSRGRLAWYPSVRDEALRAEIDSELPIFSHRLWINDQCLDSLRSQVG
jgi:hypothetical protein